MRKPYLIIISSIAAVCAVVGIIIHVYPGKGFSSGGRSIDADSFNAGGQYEKTGAFSSLDIDCGTAVITVGQGAEYAVEITARNPSKANRMPVWAVEGSTLKVYQKDDNFISLGPLNDTTYYVNVSVPGTDDEMLDKINIDSGTGTVSLNGINTDQLIIDTGTGSVNISDCRVNELEIDSGTGSLSVDLISAAKKIDIDNGTGSIDLALPGTEDDYNVDIDNGLGSVTIGDEKVRGEYKSKGSGEGAIKIDNGTGSINISFITEKIS